MVPRIILAMGVIIWALIRALLTRRPRQPVRLPPTCDDPVADVLAGARPVPRDAGEELHIDDLRWMVSADELELTEEGGCNTVVGLDDTVSSYADVYTDGLADALADQPGIDEVEHADREVLLVRSLLSLPDVQAAAIRALLAINANPRLARDRALSTAMMNSLADSAADLLAGRGFAGRLRTGAGHDHAESHGPGFCRMFTQEGLVQVLGLRGGFGTHHDDGTIADASVTVTVEVVEIAGTRMATRSEPDGCEAVVGERVLSESFDRVPASVESIEHILVTKALPLCESTTSKAAIVDRWVRGLPWYVPDRFAWEAADMAARWGFRQHARDLLKHTPRGLEQAAAVAAKHGL
jgi:hypothetical protein